MPISRSRKSEDGSQNDFPNDPDLFRTFTRNHKDQRQPHTVAIFCLTSDFRPRLLVEPDSAKPIGSWWSRARSSPSAPGGADRDRTGDLLLAKQALSQLSYGPGPRSRKSDDRSQYDPAMGRLASLTSDP